MLFRIYDRLWLQHKLDSTFAPLSCQFKSLLFERLLFLCQSCYVWHTLVTGCHCHFVMTDKLNQTFSFRFALNQPFYIKVIIGSYLYIPIMHVTCSTNIFYCRLFCRSISSVVLLVTVIWQHRIWYGMVNSTWLTLYFIQSSIKPWVMFGHSF